MRTISPGSSACAVADAFAGDVAEDSGASVTGTVVRAARQTRTAGSSAASGDTLPRPAAPTARSAGVSLICAVRQLDRRAARSAIVVPRPSASARRSVVADRIPAIAPAASAEGGVTGEIRRIAVSARALRAGSDRDEIFAGRKKHLVEHKHSARASSAAGGVACASARASSADDERPRFDGLRNRQYAVLAEHMDVLMASDSGYLATRLDGACLVRIEPLTRKKTDQHRSAAAFPAIARVDVDVRVAAVAAHAESVGSGVSAVVGGRTLATRRSASSALSIKDSVRHKRTSHARPAVGLTACNVRRDGHSAVPVGLHRAGVSARPAGASSAACPPPCVVVLSVAPASAVPLRRFAIRRKRLGTLEALFSPVQTASAAARRPNTRGRVVASAASASERSASECDGIAAILVLRAARTDDDRIARLGDLD